MLLTSDPDAVLFPDGRLAVFARGADNAIWHRWQVSRNGNWSDWAKLGSDNDSTSGPSVTINAEGGPSVFIRGTDNAIYHQWQRVRGGEWSGWAPLGGAFTSDPDATLTPDGRLVVFARGTDNAIWHRWQTRRNSDWSTDWEKLGNDNDSVSGPSATTNAPGGLVVFIRGTDNAIWHRWQNVPDGEWSEWFSLGGTFTSDPDATLSSDGRLVVFARGTDNAIWHRWQTSRNGDWSDWEKLGLDNDSVSGPGAATNAPGGLVVFIRGTDNAIWHRWQNQNNGEWSGWESLGMPRPVDPDDIVLRSAIPGFAEGSVEVQMRRDGTLHVTGHLRNDRVEGIAFRIRALVRSGPRILALVYEGSSAGSLGGEARFEDWLEDHTHASFSGSFFDQWRGASLDVSADVRGAITGFLEDVGAFALRWLIGTVLIQGGLMVIPIGVIAGSLFTPGGFAAGARIVGGALWLAGPGGTLFALGAEGLAAIGSNERELSEPEYDQANNEVFRGTLPPRDRIVLTDTIGGSGAAFAFPRFDGKITINMGSDAFDTPMVNHKATLLHELTHAWQLQNTHSEFAYISAAVGTKICEIGVGTNRLYDPGDGSRPFRDLNIEQQARAVELWANRSGTARRDYNHYIEENIRTGMA